MGEIADMMLDGTMCQGCGVWLHDGADGPGYPGYCSDCQRDARGSNSKPASTTKVACPTCGRKVKAVGLQQHQRDTHKDSPP
jgi:hypothetical protein